MQSLEGDEIAHTIGGFTTELSSNEARVLHSLVRWPNLSDQAIHSRINMKKSTFSSIKTRLKDQNYYDRYYVPNFPKIGFELFSVFFGKLNRYTTIEERLRIAKDTLESFVEDFYIASENNVAFNLSVTENLTEHEKNLEKFFEIYIINNFLSRTGMERVYFPFELSKIYSFMDYETIIAKIFGFQSEGYEKRMTIPSGPMKKFKLTRAERKVLVGLVEYPEESDTLIAERIGVSRNTVANAKRKFLKKEITFPRVVPNLQELGLNLINFNYYKFSPKIQDSQRAEIAENIREIMSPHFYVTKALDGVSVSAHISEDHFREVRDELNDYLQSKEYLIEDPISYQLKLDNISIIKQYDFLPMVMKILGFDNDKPVADQ
ncbi:MAG: helix-turn-helix transcriptional regulator [Candidatus Kariarchaeaceae archaeon]